MDPRYLITSLGDKLHGDDVHRAGARHGARVPHPGCFTIRRYGLGAFQPAG